MYPLCPIVTVDHHRFLGRIHDIVTSFSGETTKPTVISGLQFSHRAISYLLRTFFAFPFILGAIPREVPFQFIPMHLRYLEIAQLAQLARPIPDLSVVAAETTSAAMALSLGHSRLGLALHAVAAWAKDL